jgi:uncharacterized membrane protein
MHKKHKHDIIAFLSLVGFADSVYLTTAHYLGLTVPCDITHGCEKVLSSQYSQILGIPLAVLGIVFYTGIIFFSLLANHYNIFRKILSWYLALGSLLACVFLYQQFFVIKQVCQYCLVVDLLTIILFLTDLNIEHRPEKLLN